MLSAIARLAIAAPRRVIVLALLVMVGTAVFGIPVIHTLSAGGELDPGAESSQASALLSQKFDQGDTQMLITVTSNAGAQGPQATAVGTDLVQQLRNSANVRQVSSAWTVPPAAAASFISKDGKTGLIMAAISGGETNAQNNAKQLADQLVHDRDGVTVRVGGDAAVAWQVNEQTQNDLLLMESLALPLSFLVLVWVFGGLVAAALPVAVGGFAIFGSMASLHAITLFADVSIFALNLTVALGMALAVDYTLLILSRFRDELAEGQTRDAALIRTMATAGRTVVFSAMTVALSMAALVLFPPYFLKSFAYAGVAVVAFTAAAAIIVTPAAIVLLGSRLDSLDVRRLLRGILRRPDPQAAPVEQWFWYRWTKSVMRRAVPIGVAITALLLLLGTPFHDVRWGFADDRVLPTSASARQVGDQLRNDFPGNAIPDITVVLPDATDLTPTGLDDYAAALSRVPDVSSVSSLRGTFVDGTLRAGPPSSPSGIRDHSAFLTVTTTAPLYSAASAVQLDRLHAVPTPAGRPVQLAGAAQGNRDSVHAIASRLPLVLMIIAVITLVLVFLLTGSAVLPVKAALMNVLSLTAAFGALVWVFQEGHLGGLGTAPTGTLGVELPVLLFCIAFGLSMDYEVFLISRIREYWLASDRGPAANDESVALGVAHTGRVITAAALVMAISFTALMAARVSFMRLFGFGLTVAVLVDATLVRMLLVPAFMHVLGWVNWWAPGPLARLHARFGLKETAGRVSDTEKPARAMDYASTMSLEVGQVFAGYTILRVLGVGGMGAVYLAAHPRLPREDALKVLPANLTADPEFRARFLREADLAAGLSHPHIVRIHDRGEHDGQFWIAMDYVAGTDAARLLREQFPGGMPVDAVVSIVTAVGSALDYAHHRGLLHRDVKPANILLSEPDGQPGRVFLADFGVARRIDDSTGLTATIMTMGTVAYAAPEQLKGEQVDGRADQYALACTAFHLLAGTPPYDDSNAAVVITRHITAAPPSIGARRPELAGLDSVFATAMAKQPSYRFASCGEFAHRLGQQLGSGSAYAYARDIPVNPYTQDTQPGNAVTVPILRPAPAIWKRLGRRPRVLIGALAGVAVLIAGGVFAGVNLTQPRKPAAAAAPTTAAHNTPPPNTGPFTGIYTVQFGRGTSLDDIPAPGAPPSTTDTYAVRSVCGSAGCVATASHVSGESTFALTLVFDQVGGRWVSVAIASHECRDAPSEIWEVFTLQPHPDGTLAGEYTATTGNLCDGKHTVTFTRTGDVDVNSLPDPATLPPRVVSPAEALHGRYHDTRAFHVRSPKQEEDFSVTTDCLRTGDRCMSSFHAPTGAAEPLVFGDGNWRLDTSLDMQCPRSGAPVHVKKTAQFPLPQPPQNPITLLTGQGHMDQTAPCAVSVDFDETFTRIGD